MDDFEERYAHLGEFDLQDAAKELDQKANFAIMQEQRIEFLEEEAEIFDLMVAKSSQEISFVALELAAATGIKRKCELWEKQDRLWKTATSYMSSAGDCRLRADMERKTMGIDLNDPQSMKKEVALEVVGVADED
jgi:hypothetical protein